MDIAKLSLTELRRLQQRVEAEIKKRGDSARRDLIKKMQRLAADHGLSLDEVMGSPEAKVKPERKPRAKPARPVASKGATVAPKYRNPQDAAATWTGRGRKPLWVQQWIDSGKPVEELLINKA